MKIFLMKIGDAPPWHDAFLRLTEFAARDSVKAHDLVDIADEAEIIFAVVNDYNKYLRLSPPRNFVAYASFDLGFPWTRGIFPSIEIQNYDSRFARSGPYLLNTSAYSAGDLSTTRELLYSFAGSPHTHSIRRQLLTLTHPQAIVVDTSSDPAYLSNQKQSVYDQFKSSYSSLLLKSLSVLCPRGNGTGSMRLFETMEAGAVPVIVSDDWVPPLGLEWDTFSLRIREDEIASIPSVVEARRLDLPAMGKMARQAWEQAFAPDRIFNWLMNQAEELIDNSSASFAWWRARQILRPRNLRRMAPMLVNSRRSAD